MYYTVAYIYFVVCVQCYVHKFIVNASDIYCIAATPHPNYRRNATTNRKVNIVQFRVCITSVLARLIAFGLKRRNCVPDSALAYTTLTTNHGLLSPWHIICRAILYRVAWDRRVDCFKWPIGSIHCQSHMTKFINCVDIPRKNSCAYFICGLYYCTSYVIYCLHFTL